MTHKTENPGEKNSKYKEFFLKESYKYIGRKKSNYLQENRNYMAPLGKSKRFYPL